jgi:hypothetical protein
MHSVPCLKNSLQCIPRITIVHYRSNTFVMMQIVMTLKTVKSIYRFSIVDIDIVNMFGWLINCLLFYFPLKNFSLIWRRHHCRWRAAKFRPLLGAQGLWAGRDLYRTIPTVTRDLSFSGLIRRTAPFRSLLRHAWGCGGGSILTRVITGVNMFGKSRCYYYCF